MDKHGQMTVAGEVADVFAHRFVLRTHTGAILADLGPAGLERISLKAGDRVELSGEMKPSELKVRRIARAGEVAIAIEHKKKHADEAAPADPAPALRTAERNGFTVLGAPRRKPRHFEILGRDKAGDLVELHVELDGRLRKTKPIEPGDGRWAANVLASHNPSA